MRQHRNVDRYLSLMLRYKQNKKVNIIAEMRKIIDNSSFLFFLFLVEEMRKTVRPPIRKREKELCVAAQQWIDPPSLFLGVVCVCVFFASYITSPQHKDRWWKN